MTRAHESMEGQEVMGGMRSSKKMYSKNNENYDIYYNEGNPHTNNSNTNNNIHHSTNNSSSQLRSSKKAKLP